jgi:hypothetical protein
MHPDDLMKLTCCLKFWFGPGMYIAVLVSDSLACADTDVHTNLNLGSRPFTSGWCTHESW